MNGGMNAMEEQTDNKNKGFFGEVENFFDGLDDWNDQVQESWNSFDQTFDEFFFGSKDPEESKDML